MFSDTTEATPLKPLTDTQLCDGDSTTVPLSEDIIAILEQGSVKNWFV